MEQAFLLLYKLTFSPATTWKGISDGTIKVSPTAFANMHIPLTMLLAVAAEAVLHYTSMGWQTALGHWILYSMSLYAGLYFAALCIKFVQKQVFKLDETFDNCFTFSSFSSALVFVSFMAGIIAGSVFATLALSLFAFQTVYEGAKIHIANKSEHFNAFVLISGLLMILSPILMEKIILLFLPDLL